MFKQKSRCHEEKGFSREDRGSMYERWGGIKIVAWRKWHPSAAPTGGMISFYGEAGMWFAPRMRFPAIVAFLALSVCCAMAGGKKDTAKISFHIETEATDNPKMIFPHQMFGKQRYFRRIPEISSKDLVAYTPFPAEDQTSYGAVFQLKPTARRRLAAVTSTNIGRWLVCQAFGRLVDGVLIDEPVDDGAIVIWRGLSLEEIRELDKSIKRIGEKKE